MPSMTSKQRRRVRRKREKRVATVLNNKEAALLQRVRKHVNDYAGINTNAEALRFLIRNWTEN